MSEMSESERSSIIVADKFLHFEATIRQKRLVSKIGAKFGTYWPRVNFRGELGEMSECVCVSEF